MSNVMEHLSWLHFGYDIKQDQPIEDDTIYLYSPAGSYSSQIRWVIKTGVKNRDSHHYKLVDRRTGIPSEKTYVGRANKRAWVLVKKKRIDLVLPILKAYETMRKI